MRMVVILLMDTEWMSKVEPLGRAGLGRETWSSPSRLYSLWRMRRCYCCCASNSRFALHRHIKLSECGRKRHSRRCHTALDVASR